PKQLLNCGERKNLVTDRVKLVPGPTEEVSCVREIYQMVIQERTRRYWAAGMLVIGRSFPVD
ncbi:MAG: hypothetical protein WCC22_07990, partial [Terriglobales bacterium]